MQKHLYLQNRQTADTLYKTGACPLGNLWKSMALAPTNAIDTVLKKLKKHHLKVSFLVSQLLNFGMTRLAASQV